MPRLWKLSSDVIRLSQFFVWINNIIRGRMMINRNDQFGGFETT